MNLSAHNGHLEHITDYTWDLLAMSLQNEA